MSALKLKKLPHRAEAEPYYFLAKDLDYLVDDIRNIEERIRAAKEDAALSVAQAPGDGWHDNYGYEQARRDELAAAGRLAELKGILDRARLITPEDKIAESIHIGETYHFRFSDEEKIRTVQIGSWLVAPGQPGVISYQSPLAKKLLAAGNSSMGKSTTTLSITKS